jgi:hypothetical protein
VGLVKTPATQGINNLNMYNRKDGRKKKKKEKRKGKMFKLK